MRVHCYCGKGYELYYKLKKELLVGFDAFCGEECLFGLLETEGFSGRGIVTRPEIEPSVMEPPIEFWCRETGHYFRSRLEATFAKWCDFNSIRWDYEKYTIRLANTQSYTPDFWLPEYSHFVEVKGVWSGSAKKKLRRSKHLGFPIVLVPTHLVYKLTRVKIK